DPTKSIAKLLKEKSAVAGDAITVQRFARFQVGEAV
ncbi:MAG: elongation factor Ts, partial [Lentisphaerae bacterium]|nr:elongation factor Ts [Lentisphaerota bacterium]